MDIKAKFQCIEKKNQINQWGGGRPTCHVKLAPVMDDGNKTWAKATPSGSIEMQIDNPAAYDAFVLGQHYIVTFTAAPAAEKDEKTAAAS